MQTVVDPVSLFKFTASLTKFFGSAIYLVCYFFKRSSIMLTSFFEYKAGSTPESAHPPTPSATIST
jgi:hypothetical protein